MKDLIEKYEKQLVNETACCTCDDIAAESMLEEFKQGYNAKIKQIEGEIDELKEEELVFSVIDPSSLVKEMNHHRKHLIKLIRAVNKLRRTNS